MTWRNAEIVVRRGMDVQLLWLEARELLVREGSSVILEWPVVSGYGILPHDLLTEAHTQTLLEVVLPMARTLLA